MKAYAKIYRDAAGLIASGRYDRSCWAIDAVARRMFSPPREVYTEAILGGENASSVLFAEEGMDSLTAKHIRVVLLCMAAAVAEAGDL